MLWRNMIQLHQWHSLSLLSAQFVSYLAFCLAMILLFSAYWSFVYLELVLLETCTEIFSDIFWQTHIWNRVALNTHDIPPWAMLYSTEWLIEKCINRRRQTQWFMAEVWYHWLVLLHTDRKLGPDRPAAQPQLLGQTGRGRP
jgi:hypothetical protein